MNPETGEIKNFKSMSDALLEGFTVPIDKEPNASCKKCHGRGSTRVGMGKKIKFKPCKCTKGKKAIA